MKETSIEKQLTFKERFLGFVKTTRRYNEFCIVISLLLVTISLVTLEIIRFSS